MMLPAELILNERGAIYHLDLCPDELADLIITVGDPARVPEVSQYFDEIELTRSHREFVTHTGYLAGRRISVISTGIGTPNIDIVINELDALVNIDFNSRAIKPKKTSLCILRLGTTGSLQRDLAPGDVVASAYAIGLDSLMFYYETKIDHLKDLAQEFKSHTKTFNIPAFYCSKANQNMLLHFSNISQSGITTTCGGFYAPQGRNLRLKPAYDNFINQLSEFSYQGIPMTNLEMETAALYALSTIAEHQVLSLSVVLANRVTGAFSKQVANEVKTLIEKALPLYVTIA